MVSLPFPIDATGAVAGLAQSVPAGSDSELAAAWLQAGITAGLALLCLYVYRKFRKPYFAYWALAWGLYTLRLGAIMRFMATDRSIWLYWHQVVTGLSALAFLWAALVFSQQLAWRWRYLALGLFPVLWSWVAIYRLDSFLMAAGPAVAFLAAATAWTGVVLLRHQRRVDSFPARLLGWAFVMWSLHHLDYPFLRARGAWNPWGYYIDIAFELAIGAAILLLVLEEQDRGLRVLSGLAGDLQAEGSERDVLGALLRRPLTLPGVRGSALYLAADGEPGRFVAGEGACADWPETTVTPELSEQLAEVVRSERPVIRARGPDPGGTPFTAALPVFRADRVEAIMIVTAEARDPFSALDEPFLIALGHQLGAALTRRDLLDRLRTRGHELQVLAGRMLEQHEAERQRLSRELHDETAQVLAAVRLQIGRALETASGPEVALMERAVEMVGTGIRGVRRVIDDLRPALLDDLGLRAALAAVAFEFERTSGIDTVFRAPERLVELSDATELALFRACQEGLANVARHADATSVEVAVDISAGTMTLTIEDDGTGFPSGVRSSGGAGITGMEERASAVGGRVELSTGGAGGARLSVLVPAGPGGPE